MPTTSCVPRLLRAVKALWIEVYEHIPWEQIPHYIRFVDEFPMTVTGKIQKLVMRQQMQSELQVSEAPTA